MQQRLNFMGQDVQVQWQLTTMRIKEWFLSQVFHLRWWLLLALFIIVLYTWWKLVDKSKLNEIVIYTGLIILEILILDELGEELTLWNYPVDIIPLFPPMSSVDFSCMPMVYSLIYQYFRTWKSFIVANVVMALIFCFVLEPLFHWTGMYQMLSWKSYYGFPIYISMAIITKLLVIKIYSVTAKVF